jgi:group I intron endonuclease
MKVQMGEIYKLTCIPSNKNYIGKVFSFRPDGRKRGSSSRWSDHKSEALRLNAPKNTCTYLNNAIRKYGPENFKLEIVHITADESELPKLEQEYIQMYNSLVPNGYNLTKGGEGCRASDELKKILSEKKDYMKKEITIWNEKEPNVELYFKSFHDAARALGFHAGSIRRSCEIGYCLGKKEGIKYYAKYKSADKE